MNWRRLAKIALVGIGTFTVIWIEGVMLGLAVGADLFPLAACRVHGHHVCRDQGYAGRGHLGSDT